MKITFIKTLFFAAIILGLGATAQAEDLPRGQQVNSGKTVSKPTYVQEYQAITEVLNKYIEGCKQAKSSTMKPAFNQHATMYSVGADGKLAGGAIPILFEGIDKDFHPSPDAQAAITRIEIVGMAASARIDANDMSGISFTDFFHLLKVEGKWTVVNKIFYTYPNR
ncbi:nuclear transport factor 2 family protein [Acinetobacter calcoaceticus]|uniref:nuclear transport factor 2 family protein n=1 Tax=Acinetobacter calcoaceticus TaxID=471 RepID=UPI001D1811A3|nr:nuclear transport factor 2 family protein [Acinetobacter calcoaceticus]